MEKKRTNVKIKLRNKEEEENNRGAVSVMPQQYLQSPSPFARLI